VLLFGAGLLVLGSLAWSSDDKDKAEIEKRITASATVLNENHGYA